MISKGSLIRVGPFIGVYAKVFHSCCPSEGNRSVLDVLPLCMLSTTFSHVYSLVIPFPMFIVN